MVKLHNSLGLVSAITYLISVILIGITFLVYQFVQIYLLAVIHMTAVIIALMAVVGMVCWWIIDYRNKETHKRPESIK